MLDSRGDGVRIGIDAPRGVKIQREEVVRAVAEANVAAAAGADDDAEARLRAALGAPRPPRCRLTRCGLLPRRRPAAPNGIRLEPRCPAVRPGSCCAGPRRASWRQPGGTPAAVPPARRPGAAPFGCAQRHPARTAVSRGSGRFLLCGSSPRQLAAARRYPGGSAARPPAGRGAVRLRPTASGPNRGVPRFGPVPVVRILAAPAGGSPAVPRRQCRPPAGRARRRSAAPSGIRPEPRCSAVRAGSCCAGPRRASWRQTGGSPAAVPPARRPGAAPFGCAQRHPARTAV
ncbi:carbon storage regulator [Curtobacterium sp. MCPF17_052]|uniref:carbon storage regulator n=1 Tax=Curtobacterium sp. MCPF17_052 TaxID=2175655 RepID=UPI003464AFFA